MQDAKEKRNTTELRRGLKKMVHMLYYSKLVTFTFISLIIAQMVFVIFERPDYRASTWPYQSGATGLLIVELLMTLYYTFVISLKMILTGKKFFRTGFNLTSFIVVVIMFIDIVIALSGITIPRFSRFLRPLLLITKVSILGKKLKYYIFIRQK